MFKVIAEEYEYFDELRSVSYYKTTRIAFGKSPKRAFEKLARYNGEHIVYGGHPLGIGGIPILRKVRIEKNGKILKEIY